MQPDILVPDWPAPANVKAIVTTRKAGFSERPFDSFNLAAHVDDDPQHVSDNRALLRTVLPADPVWLTQIHGHKVIDAAEKVAEEIKDPEADGSFTRQANTVCAVLTADCLPVLFCNKAGTIVGAIHAGWKGLASGILEHSIECMMRASGSKPEDLMVWLGPAIGPKIYEVGNEVRQVFTSLDSDTEKAFKLSPGTTLDTDKWFANLYELARIRLRKRGITDFYGGQFCTFTQQSMFYSYRRDGKTGRMASLIWLSES